MEFEQFLSILSRKKQTIAIVTMVFVIFAVAITFVQPLRFSAQSKVLVMQALPEGVDPYQVSKSNEHVASLLTQVISTNSFLTEILNSGYNVNKAYFDKTGDKRVKLWKKTVKASSDANGIITIRVYHNNRVQVNEISEAVSFVLATKHKTYHGFGDQVSVKVIEEPVTSDRPVKPNILINIGVAFGFGILVSMTYIYLFPDRRFDLRIMPQNSPHYASTGITPGRDEFTIQAPKTPIKNEVSYMENFVRAKEEKMAAEAARETEAYEKLRGAMSPPVGLPFVPDEEDEEVELPPAPVYQNPERRGSMDNILKRPNQRA